jgi:uncharacterized membrane protein
VDIYVDWDGVRSDYAVSATYGRNAVWVDLALVNHFETATTDSSGNNTGTVNNARVFSGDVDFVIGQPIAPATF